MEEGVPENDNWNGDSHTSQLPLPQISFQKLCHIIHLEPPGFQLKGKSQTSRAQTTAALLWWLSTINSFLPALTNPELVEKNYYRTQESVGSVPGTGFVTRISYEMCLLSPKGVYRNPWAQLWSGTLHPTTGPQKWPIFLTSRDLPWKKNRNGTDGAAFSNPCECHEISSFPLSRPQRLPLQLFIS